MNSIASKKPTKINSSLPLIGRALFFSIFLSLCGPLTSFSQIWIGPITTGTQTSYFLGDKLGATYMQFEIGQASWNSSRVGIGTSSSNSSSYTFYDAAWYDNGGGSNKKVQANLCKRVH